MAERRGSGQKSTACSEDISVMEFYLPVLTFHLLWSIIFIFCVLVSHGMNEIVFGERRGRGQETILARKISLSGIFIEKMASE